MLTEESATSVSPQATCTRWNIYLTVSPRRSLAIRMVVSRIRPNRSFPFCPVARSTIADALLNIGSEISIHHGLVAEFFGMRLGERDGF